MTAAYRRPEALRGDHVLDAFECQSSEQTMWLRRYARQSAAVGSTRVFVVTEFGSLEVVAYYGWCMAQLHPMEAPPRLRKGGGATRNPSPSSPASAWTSATKAGGSAPPCSRTSSSG